MYNLQIMNKSTKICAKCGQQKPLSDFSKFTSIHGIQYGNKCLACRHSDSKDQTGSADEEGSGGRRAHFALDNNARKQILADNQKKFLLTEGLHKHERDKKQILAEQQKKDKAVLNEKKTQYDNDKQADAGSKEKSNPQEKAAHQSAKEQSITTNAASTKNNAETMAAQLDTTNYAQVFGDFRNSEKFREKFRGGHFADFLQRVGKLSPQDKKTAQLFEPKAANEPKNVAETQETLKTFVKTLKR